MLDAFDRDAWPEHVTKHVQLRATEALTCRGGGADRAVIFQQQEPLRIGAPFGHVAFVRTEPGEPLDTRAQRGGAGECGAVRASGLLLANADQSLQRCLAESGSHRFDQADGELGMRIWEAAVSRRCQMPDARWPSEAEFFGNGCDQLGAGELGELLAHGLGRGAECRGNVR